MNLYLRALSLLVPQDRREEWFLEWHAELWHLRAEGARIPYLLSFLQGAMPDAWALYRQNRASEMAPPREAQALRSPDGRGLLLRFAIGLLAALALALLTPGSRRVLLAHPFHPAGEIVFLEDTLQPSTSYAEYLDWAGRRNSPFRQLAFYSAARNMVRTGSGAFHETVAHASPNLLHLLGLAAARAVPATQPSVYLTAASADRLGHPEYVLIANRRLPVAGIVPETTLSLPGDPGLFLLDTRIPSGMHGHVLAYVDDGAPDLRWGLSLLHPGGFSSHLSCIPIATFIKTPLRAFIFALILALLALPATHPLSRQDSPLDRHHLPLHRRFLPSGFLLAQLSCLLGAVYFLSLALATLLPGAEPSNSSLLEAVIAFTLLLPGLRLTLRDHRHRCPCCMRRLAHPARVGQPSAAFLQWYGTELLCTRGHGLLHVPELPTTWFPTARWTPLDSSWSALFR